MPKWLVYSILTLLLWGGWGVLGKVVANDLSPSESQAFSRRRTRGRATSARCFSTGSVRLVPLGKSSRLRSRMFPGW